MSDQRISALLALSLVASPFAIPSTSQASPSFTPSTEIASQKTSLRRMRNQLSPAPLLKPMGGNYVGELQEKWQFPSDHLPIGITFEDLHLVSWNVLDAAYMSWVTEKNSQGLSRSLIAEEHVYIGNSQLTIRDQHVVDLILQTISHPIHPHALLSLQECSEALIEELRSRLPERFEVISHFGEAVLVDRHRFEIVDAKSVAGLFRDEPYRTVQDVLLRRLDNGSALRIVNGHLPGDPLKPARHEFAQYLAQTLDPTVATLAMGDMNFNELEMGEAFDKAFEHQSPFSIYTPYCTNISPHVFTSKAIDHFFVYSPNTSPVAVSAPGEIMEGLAPIVDLLEGKTERTSEEEVALFAKQNCLNEGSLQKTRDYVYLKLNDEYLAQIFNKIKEIEPGVRMPRFGGDIGPHITIIRHDEWKGRPPRAISELGAQYMFVPVRVEVIQTAHKRLWTLVIEPSAELSSFREKYADGAMPHGHEFHITVAQQSL